MSSRITGSNDNGNNRHIDAMKDIIVICRTFDSNGLIEGVDVAGVGSTMSSTCLSTCNDGDNGFVHFRSVDDDDDDDDDEKGVRLGVGENASTKSPQRNAMVPNTNNSVTVVFMLDVDGTDADASLDRDRLFGDVCSFTGMVGWFVAPSSFVPCKQDYERS